MGAGSIRRRTVAHVRFRLAATQAAVRHGRAVAASKGDNAPMHIILNGETLTLDAVQTIAELLVARGLAGRRVAVEVNGEIVPRGRHDEHCLAEGDRVEIVHALGGG